MARTPGREDAIGSKTPRIATLASFAVIIAAMFFMREVLIPVALAILVTFLLTPVVNRLERWHFGRVGAVLAVVALTFVLFAVLGYVVTLQVLNLANDLPQYRSNIIDKIRTFHSDGNGALDKAAEALKDVQQAVNEPATTQSTQPTPAEQAIGIEEPPQVPRMSPRVREDIREAEQASLPGTSKDKPLWTAVVTPRTPMERLGQNLGLILGPLGTAGLVVVFMIFMLLQREDLRDRLIRLVGQGQLNLTTEALDDAANRISRYLLAQAIVNGSYGIAISIGLYTIGEVFGDRPFPNFILWGLLCAVLRFIPYIGPWIAASFPLAVAFAVYPGYSAFVATGIMFVVIELLSNNVMEPWLYGSSTGMSAVAVLVSAVFWTFLWGPIGLVMATPLTVCLVVLGKYVPQLAFLDVLLGDEPVLSPPERIYQRLLAQDEEEASELLEAHLAGHSLEQTFDEVLMPALAMVEQDRHRGRLSDQRQRFIHQSMRNLVEELTDRAQAMRAKDDSAEQVRIARGGAPVATGKTSSGNGATSSSSSDDASGTSAEPAQPVRMRLPEGCTVNVLCLPAHDEADEITGLMLVQLLELQGFCAYSASVKSLAGEMVEMVGKHDADLVVVGAMPPAAVTHSRYLCKRVHARHPDIKMIVGLWTYRGDLKKAKDRITCVATVQVMTTLGEAIDQIQQIAQPLLLERTSTRPAQS